MNIPPAQAAGACVHPPRKPPFSDICESGEPTAAASTAAASTAAVAAGALPVPAASAAAAASTAAAEQRAPPELRRVAGVIAQMELHLVRVRARARWLGLGG